MEERRTLLQHYITLDEQGRRETRVETFNRMQELVRQFNVANGNVTGSTPALRDVELRAKLIEEEAAETVKSIRAGDFVEAIDGLCDLLYVVFGAAYAFNINLEPFFDEVHRTNMAKLQGPVRADGKRLKPEGWKPPRIREILAIQPGVDLLPAGHGNCGTCTADCERDTTDPLSRHCARNKAPVDDGDCGDDDKVAPAWREDFHSDG